jgi:hypothetical protein
MNNIKLNISTPPTLVGGHIHRVHRESDEIGGVYLPPQLERT